MEEDEEEEESLRQSKKAISRGAQMDEMKCVNCFLVRCVLEKEEESDSL